MVLHELADGDLIGVSAFNDQVKDLSNGMVKINDAAKKSLGSKIQSIQADGMTSLYDVTLASGLQVIQASASVKGRLILIT